MPTMFRRTFLTTVLTAFVLSLPLMSALGAAEERPAMQSMLSQAKQRIEEVSPSQAAAMIASTPDLVVVDVRTLQEFQAGHLRGAKHLDRGLLEFRVEREIPDKSAPILVYCRSGGRGALATATLMEMGYTNVRNLAGGFMGWQEAGLPVTQG